MLTAIIRLLLAAAGPAGCPADFPAPCHQWQHDIAHITCQVGLYTLTGYGALPDSEVAWLPETLSHALCFWDE